MGNALWTGVRLKELLAAARIRPGTVLLLFQGLDRGPGPEGKGADVVMKSLDLADPPLDETVWLYLMNGEPLPMLNGFPVRLIVPGKFGVYRKGTMPVRSMRSGPGPITLLRLPTARAGTSPRASPPPLPSATWESEVNKMIRVFGAPIPEAAAQHIIAYLRAQYTPETRKE
jgi:DMSO/TMAO reductase YedYZ molybdopterin-dependent catalytic subunit